MTEEEYKEKFIQLIENEKKEVNEYIEKNGIEEGILDSKANKIYKKYGLLMKKLQDEYWGNN